MNWQEIYKSKLVSLEDSVKAVKSGDRIFYSAGCSAPPDLINALTKRYQELENVTLISGLLLYPFEYLKPQYRGHLNHLSIFLGPVERKFMPFGNVEINSYHFSQTDWLSVNYIKANVLMCECSPPDERGYMSYGPLGTFNNNIVKEHAQKVLVQVNKRTPYVYGSKNLIHVTEVDCIFEKDHEIPELPNIPVTELEKKIGSYIAERIEDGSTIQIGLGGIANAVGYLLESKKDLGVHTEMLVDSMVALAKKGVITCKKKTFMPGQITCGFGIGSRELYDFMDRNPLVGTHPTSFVNNVYNIAANDNFVSINNALTVDLTGQAGSESLGYDQYSCTGGQLDFVRGASMSKGGKSFIALESTAKSKEGSVSRIVTKFLPGQAVTTPRTDIQYVVTEFGVAELRNKSIPERVKEMVSIAHPDFREQLLKEAKEARLIY